MNKLILTLFFLLLSNFSFSQISELPKNALKFSISSPLTGHVNLTYERATGRKESWEAGFDIIGIGINNPIKGQGFGLNFGYRAYSSQSLNGFYFMSNINMPIFKYTDKWEEYEKDEYYNLITVNRKEDRNVFALIVSTGLGYQFVIANSVCIDIYAGTGYGFSTEDCLYYFGNIGTYIGDDAGYFFVSGGIRIGGLFNFQNNR